MTNGRDSSVGNEAVKMHVIKSLTIHVKLILLLRGLLKMITTIILPLPRIQEEQLSASGQKLKGTQGIGKLPQLG